MVKLNRLKLNDKNEMNFYLIKLINSFDLDNEHKSCLYNTIIINK